MPAHLIQLGVAVENVPDDQSHLGEELPILVRRDHLGLADHLRQVFAGVDIQALVAVGLDPGDGLLVLLVVVDLQGDAAGNLGHVHPLGADAQVLLEHTGVAIAACNAHGHTAHVDVGLVLHPAHSYGALGKAKNFLRSVGGHRGIRGLLYIVAVNGEGGQTLLGVGGHDGSQVYSAGTLGAVKAPHGLDGPGIHVEGLAAVAPAAGDGESCHHILGGELVGAGSGLRAAANGGVRDDALHRGTVGIAQILLDERLGAVGHSHGLLFQALPDTAPAAVNGGANANLWIQHEKFLLQKF